MVAVPPVCLPDRSMHLDQGTLPSASFKRFISFLLEVSASTGCSQRSKTWKVCISVCTGSSL